MHLYACNLFKTLSWLRQFKFKAASSAKQPYTGRIVRTFAEEKIGKNPKLLEDYKAFVEDIVVKRYIRRPPPYQRESVCEVKTWYIPHRGVYHPQGQVKYVWSLTVQRGIGESQSKIWYSEDQTSPIFFWKSSYKISLGTCGSYGGHRVNVPPR